MIGAGQRGAVSSVRGDIEGGWAQPGQPLYQTVKQTVREAIDSGLFRPGQQMPSTKELSEKLSVSLVTVRTHLQHVFDKTDTHRQAELVRLLLVLGSYRPGSAPQMGKSAPA